ncbi:HlyD family secretion protein [Staphylococcus lutrae]|uniref:Multidrug efflux protein n=1 Tax=Staphylococcus lutrae TaxID=155085 RepID=A0AAC9WJC3_9STAP|nr:HlyD family efflux transporter periplasmic adaptor subunit [Staphylococcus lutrae]ARJ51134.1 multidrug efflux protein [Staphylococcus lutrae]PNZ34807.1 HlyD family secretion protein [Staphylococcus lutrae]
MKKIILVNIVTIVALVVIGIVGFYFYNQSANYIKTDNAKVDGVQIKIASPASGKLTDLNVGEGDQLKKGETVAKLQTAGEGDGPQTMTVQMPKTGTIVKLEAQEEGIVQAGQPIAYAYDMNDLYITANIDETAIKDVQAGQEVDVTIDGQDAKIKGKVDQLGFATASSFSLMPSSNSDGNYTKVTQVVPVKIKLDNPPAHGVVPGMNAEVRIHKN